MKKYDKALYRITIIQQRLFEGYTLDKLELANEFNVSEKTIQRDINERLNSLQIVHVKGIGFKLDDEYIDNHKAQFYATQAKEILNETQLMLNITKAQEAIENADAILISAGAGIGVDSGLPDFRGNDGFWNAYPPMKKLGLNFADIANPKWFSVKPELAWGFYGHRLMLYRNTIPHEGFDILKKLANYKNNNYFIFTSNVDGQFQKAGFDCDKIIECHGSIHFNQCINNCTNNVWTNSESTFDVDISTFTVDKSQMPYCPHCGNLARPNIMMFGDYSYNPSRYHEQNKKFNQWLIHNINSKAKIVVIEIGAGKHIPTVRRLSEEISKQYGATLIRINPRDYDVPQSQISLSLGGLEGLQTIFNY